MTYISNCHLEREACRFPEKKLHAKEIGKCPEVDPREEHRRAAIDGDETCDKEDPEDCAVAVTEREALQLFRPTSNILILIILHFRNSLSFNYINFIVQNLLSIKLRSNAYFLLSFKLFVTFYFQVFVRVLLAHSATVGLVGHVSGPTCISEGNPP